MKIISIWQPYASLIVHGHKAVETRSWSAPQSLIGKRIGIAATKRISPEQKALFMEKSFMEYYTPTGLPGLMGLPHGAILGTVLLHSCSVMDEEDLENVTEEEQIFGHWDAGRFAWRLRKPVLFPEPVFTRGFQGIWDYDLEDQGEGQERPSDIRSYLQLVKG